MLVLCTICARGGSQGIKNKNLVSLRGKPLIAHTILQAKKANFFADITVSSDSDTILAVAKKWEVDHLVKRPTELASATAAKIPVIQHAVLETERLTHKEFDIIMDLDVTSPLRSIEDIHGAFNLFMQHKAADNLVTGFASRRSPYFNMLELDANGFAKLAKIPEQAICRRQDAPSCFDMNASIYIWKRPSLFQSKSAITAKTLLYVMSEEKSVDIDSPLDLKLVRLLARNRKDLT